MGPESTAGGPASGGKGRLVRLCQIRSLKATSSHRVCDRQGEGGRRRKGERQEGEGEGEGRNRREEQKGGCEQAQSPGWASASSRNLLHQCLPPISHAHPARTWQKLAGKNPGFPGRASWFSPSFTDMGGMTLSRPGHPHLPTALWISHFFIC